MRQRKIRVPFETLIMADVHLFQVGCYLCLLLFAMMVLLRWGNDPLPLSTHFTFGVPSSIPINTPHPLFPYCFDK